MVLPEGTWRALKKGYEEVHVPAIKHIPDADERLVEIEELPAWTHKAFRCASSCRVGFGSGGFGGRGRGGIND